ncbi:MAG: alpha/beta fold hydrolase [Polyangiales bacterium]
MIERAVSFGRSSNLIGIVSEPDVFLKSSRPDILILNSGLTHKIGAFRMSVDLARKLAADGFRVLRFDISGVGDSRVRLAREAGEDIPVSDVRDAMDFLSEHHGTGRFVLMGLCSGSDNSHRTAVADPRVVGAAHLDGLGFRTPRYYANFYGPRLRSGTFLATQLKRRLLASRRPTSTTLVNSYERKFPPIEQVARDFAALMARNVRLLYVYTHGAHLYTNYRDQLREAFPSIGFGDRLEVEMYPYAEHTYPTVRSRATVVNRVVDWAQRIFGG